MSASRVMSACGTLQETEEGYAAFPFLGEGL